MTDIELYFAELIALVGNPNSAKHVAKGANARTPSGKALLLHEIGDSANRAVKYDMLGMVRFIASVVPQVAHEEGNVRGYLMVAYGKHTNEEIAALDDSLDDYDAAQLAKLVREAKALAEGDQRG